MILESKLPVLDSIRLKVSRSPFIRIFRFRRHERLVRSYFFASVILIAGGLISAGVLEIYLRYMEELEQVGLAQQDAATNAALRIERFIQDVATTMTAATKSAGMSSVAISSDYEFELKRLLFLAPTITEALAVDADGVIQAQVSRFRAVSPLLRSDVSQSAAFQESKQGKYHFGTVYFRDSDPYITVSVPVERLAGEVMGVLQAEASLRDVLDVVSGLKLGRAGYAYVVTRSGDVIAHPKISLVLQSRNLGQLDQMKVAFQPTSGALKPRAIVTHNIEGLKVFSSHALIPILGWAVFIERPVGEAYAPIYASLLRTSVLLLIGLGVALVATLFVRRRVVLPLESLRQGVERIGQGDLNARLELKTGDEIEILADEFNQMATSLRQAYAGLEEKVAERTHELTVANVKLAEASKHKSQFLANVNHELRTPVSAIIGYARLVIRETTGQIAALQRENLHDLLRNAERLLHQIDSLLDLAKIEAGKVEVRVEPVAVDEIIDGAAATIEPMLNPGSVRLIREIAPGVPTLNTDREKFRQIVLNLLDNAVKFTKSGKIRIMAFQENGSFKLVVSDTGIGIAKDDLSQIFEEFHRGRLSGTDGYRGTGLGLAIVKKFVQLLGGEISVESEAGKGSTFSVMMPFEPGKRADV
jgi:signal transduction histidine kinase